MKFRFSLSLIPLNTHISPIPLLAFLENNRKIQFIGSQKRKSGNITGDMYGFA
jgi:hypothetical protein